MKRMINARTTRILGLAILLATAFCAAQGQEPAKNPILWADVPDVAVCKVGDEFYMSSTTMHMSPGIPIMKSKNLVDWTLVGYARDVIEDSDALALRNGKNAYGAGDWASSLRYKDGTFYLATFSGTTGKTYVYTTDNPAGEWQARSFRPMFHDCSLFLEDDGRVFLIHGSSNIRLTELRPDFSGVLQGGLDMTIVENAEKVAGGRRGLPAEGSQFFKRNGKYYLCNITWPAGGERVETVYRADKLEGPYEGRLVFKDRGIAQGTIFEGVDGKWFAMLFQDSGAVGRIPYLIPVEWVDDWPVLGVDGKAPERLDITLEGKPLGNIVESCEFDAAELPLAFQWNHNPVAQDWSLTERSGWLKLVSSRVDSKLVQTRNIRTQRTFGPTSSCQTLVDPAGLKEGDVAGLTLLQRKYGYVAVTKRDGKLYLAQGEAKTAPNGRGENDANQENELVALKDAAPIYLRADCDFTNRRDRARFYWSVDGTQWRPIGGELRMVYTLPHFMGYRFGLFLQSTQESGGEADFDFFRVDNNTILNKDFVR